jgi:hypothetical protein
MQNLINKYIEISSEEEMQKATNWLTSLGWINPHSNPEINKETFVYLFIGYGKHFHFNDMPEKSSHWKPFSVLYEEGMPRDVLMGYRTAEITGSIGHIVRDEEDLLAKAKRLYPIGTKYKSAAGHYEVHTVESMDWAPSPPGHIYGEFDKGCIYINGKWAEIVHEVKPIEKWSVNSYLVFLNEYGGHPKGTISKIINNEPEWAQVEHLFYRKSEGCRLYKDKECKWFATFEEAKKFAATIKQSVEKKEFIPDDNLSSYIGRYLEALVDFPNGGKVKKGEYGLIINHSQANFPSHIGYHCSEALKKNNLNIRYRLMPEGFTPPVKEEEWKPKVGDWVVTDNLRINDTGDGGKYNGTIGQIWKIGSILVDDWYKPVESMHFTGGSLKLHNLRKATQQEIDFMSKTTDIKPPESKFEDMSKDELLDYAKKKYPIGTKVKFPGFNERIISQELYWQYKNLISHSGCCPILDIKDGKYVWAEIVEPPKAEVLTSNQSTYQPIVTSYSYNGIKETHQSINKTGKQFSPIKAELIKVKQLKIN